MLVFEKRQRVFLVFLTLSVLILIPFQIQAQTNRIFTVDQDSDVYIHINESEAHLGHYGGVCTGDVNGDGNNDLVASAFRSDIQRDLGVTFLPEDQDSWTEEGSLSQWSVNGNGSNPTISTVHIWGNHSIATTRISSGSLVLINRLPTSFSLNLASDKMHLSIYTDSNNERLNYIDICAPNYQNRFRYTYQPNLILNNQNWTQIDLDLSNFTVVSGNPDWNNVRMMRIGFANQNSNSNILVDHFYFDHHGLTTIQDVGAVYLFYGPLSGNIEAGSADVTIYGIDEGDLSGEYIAIADINNDGYGDIIFGAAMDDGPNNDRIDAGVVYCIFGGNNLPKIIDLSTDIADYIIYGADAGDELGMEVHAFDINSDSIQDLIIGAPHGDGSGQDNGELYIVLGSNNLSGILDLKFNNANLCIYGKSENDTLGVQGTIEMGDVNNDGLQDLVFGSLVGEGNGEPQNTNEGKVYIINNIGNYSGTIDLATFTPDTVIYGAGNNDRLARIAIGDFNGDNIDDIIMGAPGGDGPNNSRTDCGEVYVVYGTSSLPSEIDLRLTIPDVLLIGVDMNDAYGGKVYAADVNFDGIDDILVTAGGGDGNNNSKIDSGDAYVIYGNANRSGTIDLGIIPPEITIYGADAGDNLRDIFAGDISGDGISDIILGYRWGDGINNAYTDSGDVFSIFYEQPDTTLPTVSSTNPVSDAINVDINSVVTATFSEPMNPDTIINVNTFTVSGITGAVTYDPATLTATFTPSNPLSYSVIYTATITTDAQDTAGNAMASNYSWSFTTSDGLTQQAIYAFDEGSGETATDSSGNGNDGTIIGATWTTGKNGGALSFNGINNYVSIPRLNNEEFSISAWFYKNINDTAAIDGILGGYRWNSNIQLREGFDIRFNQGAPDTLKFILVTQDGSGNRTERTATRNLINSISSWYHVAGTYNKTTGEQKLYVNGQLVNTRTHPLGNTIVPLTFYPDMRIGFSRSNGYFNGIIDDVRIYNRALSNKEVLDMFTAFNTGIQALYAFDEGSGTIATDSSGNGNHGTISGASWTTGYNGGGLNFDGTSNYVSIPRMNYEEVSMCAWFYKDINDTAAIDAIFGGYRWNSNIQLREGFAIRFNQDDPNTLRFILVTQDGSGNRTQRTAAMNLINSTSSWYHVAGTYNKTTGEQKLYINGQPVNTQSHPAGNTVVPLTFYPDMRIGFSRPNGYFNGVIDDVRLYNRVLSDLEVLDLYTQ
jgi:hypothetical protein